MTLENRSQGERESSAREASIKEDIAADLRREEAAIVADTQGQRHSHSLQREEEKTKKTKNPNEEKRGQ